MPTVLATGRVSNPTRCSLTVQSSSTQGTWVLQPQPVPADSDVQAFQAIPQPGGTASVSGEVVYAVMEDGENVGTCTLTFDDPYSGHNSAGFSTTVDGLSGTVQYPQNGSNITFLWTLSTS